MKNTELRIDMAASDLFDRYCDERARKIDYDPSWASGSTYDTYLGAVFGPAAPALEPGEIVHSVSPVGRRLLLIGSELGNVVVYTPMLHTCEFLWVNSSEAMQDYICSHVRLAPQRKGIFKSGCRHDLLRHLLGHDTHSSVSEAFRTAASTIRVPFLQRFDEEVWSGVVEPVVTA